MKETFRKSEIDLEEMLEQYSKVMEGFKRVDPYDKEVLLSL